MRGAFIKVVEAQQAKTCNNYKECDNLCVLYIFKMVSVLIKKVERKLF
jgi:hypothetical protein